MGQANKPTHGQCMAHLDKATKVSKSLPVWHADRHCTKCPKLEQKSDYKRKDNDSFCVT